MLNSINIQIQFYIGQAEQPPQPRTSSFSLVDDDNDNNARHSRHTVFKHYEALFNIVSFSLSSEPFAVGPFGMREGVAGSSIKDACVQSVRRQNVVTCARIAIASHHHSGAITLPTIT